MVEGGEGQNPQASVIDTDRPCHRKLKQDTESHSLSYLVLPEFYAEDGSPLRVWSRSGRHWGVCSFRQLSFYCQLSAC